MIKAIIFDYDGVIVDSFSSHHRAHQILCRELGVKCPENVEEFKRVFGYNFIEGYQNLGISKKDYPKAGKIYERERLKSKLALFGGIKKVLKELSQNYKLILISSNYIKELKQKLENFQMSNYFSEVIGADVYHKRFDKTEPIKQFMQKQGLNPNQVIFIGDRNVDYDEGKKAGLKHILLVEYGWGYDHKIIPRQEYIIEKPADILKAVKSLN